MRPRHPTSAAGGLGGGGCCWRCSCRRRRSRRARASRTTSAISSRDIYDFTDLRQAIDRDDRAAIEAALDDAQDLVDRAPSDIENDIEAVVDAVVDSVRAVIDVEGPDGQNMPVDLARLNDALAKVGENAQRVVRLCRREMWHHHHHGSLSVNVTIR